MISAILILLAGVHFPLASGHASIFHPSMWGFNVTDHTYPYDNRPVSPLINMTFEQWWFHGHLDHPPNPGDIFDLPAGQTATTEIGCNKGATSYFASSEGGDIRSGDDPCPGSPPSEYHTNGPDDLKGCSLAIAYKDDVNQVQPEDFTVFSVNQTCVFHRFTDFQVPARMPPCPAGGCICAWFWIHSQDSGGEQNYMNGFKCNITGSTSNVALAKPQVPRRCGADPDNGKMQASPGNCTYGAKQPFYWFQAERNNMFEGTYSPPFYLDLYNFKDGAQDDIFEDSYPNGLPSPSPNATAVPTPFLGGGSPTSTVVSSISAASVASSSSSIISVASSSSLSSSVTGTSASPSLSASSSTPSVTVTQTILSIVTVTNTPSPSIVSADSSTTTTDTIPTSIIQTSPVSSDSSLFATSIAPSSSPATTINLNLPSPSGSAVQTSSNNLTDISRLAQLERVTGDTNALLPAGAVNTTTSDNTDTAPIPSSTSSTIKTCPRRSNPTTNLQKRSTTGLFEIPVVKKWRKMDKRSSLWHLF
ncbi:hypothetical protein C8Q75DRAFT_804519 [Abortiporus biennis]|nr:hypothetical protein C8Q75DRAFT_804519 [Abortiporus biennis]